MRLFFSTAGLCFRFRFHCGRDTFEQAARRGGEGFFKAAQRRPCRGSGSSGMFDTEVFFGRRRRNFKCAAVCDFVFGSDAEYQAAWNGESRKGEIHVFDPSMADSACLALLRQVLVRILPFYGGITLHAACVAVDGGAYVFGGCSGAGKSTVCALSRGNAEIIAEDMTLARRVAGKWLVWGWPPPAAFAQGVPLKALFRLVKARRHAIMPVSAAQAFAAMLVVPQFGGAYDYRNMLAVCEKLAAEVPVHELQFAKNAAFWQRILRGCKC